MPTKVLGTSAGIYTVTGLCANQSWLFVFCLFGYFGFLVICYLFVIHLYLQLTAGSGHYRDW